MGVLYSDMKLFHFQEKLDSLPRQCAIEAPVHLRLKPINRCNHNCHYCAYRASQLQLGQDMRLTDSIPRNKMLEICHDIVAMGVKAVTYSGGGEPLLYPYLLEASRILREGGARVACLTNGALLAGEIADYFAHNATWVRVSMDGWDDASYRRYRGVQDGEFSRIMGNLEAFAKRGGACVLGVSYIVDSQNWTHIQDMLRRYKDAGVRSVKISACIVSNSGVENNKCHAPHFEAVYDIVQQAMQDMADCNFEIMDAWHTLEEHFVKQYEWCPFSQVLAVIGADLGVYPCQDKAYNKSALLGSLKEQSFKDFWMNGKEAFFRIRPSKDCQHHCVANNKNIAIMNYLNIDRDHMVFV